MQVTAIIVPTPCQATQLPNPLCCDCKGSVLNNDNNDDDDNDDDNDNDDNKCIISKASNPSMTTHVWGSKRYT